MLSIIEIRLGYKDSFPLDLKISIYNYLVTYLIMKKLIIISLTLCLVFIGFAFLILFEASFDKTFNWWSSYSRDNEGLPYSPYKIRREDSAKIRIDEANQKNRRSGYVIITIRFLRHFLVVQCCTFHRSSLMRYSRMCTLDTSSHLLPKQPRPKKQTPIQ